MREYMGLFWKILVMIMQWDGIEEKNRAGAKHPEGRPRTGLISEMKVPTD